MLPCERAQQLTACGGESSAQGGRSTGVTRDARSRSALNEMLL